MTQPDVITNPCGCNQPHAVHERGDEGWCRATQAVEAVVKAWRTTDVALLEHTHWRVRDALDDLEQVWTLPRRT